MTNTRPEPMIRVKLSATICNEYDSRAVFGGGEWPDVPYDAWTTYYKGGATVEIPASTALVMLDDAEYNGSCGRHAGQGPDEMPLGIGNAYRALARQIRAALASDQTSGPTR